MALNDEELERLRQQYTKIGVVDWNRHQIVFKQPSREVVRDYRRKQDSASEKPDALDQLAQVTIVAFDGVTDPVRCREAFLAFLGGEAPAFTSSGKAGAVLTGLSGMVEEEDVADLGKGARILMAPRPTSPAVSPSGSNASSTTAS